MAVHVPAGAARQRIFGIATFGVDGDDDALRAKFFGCVFNHLRVGERGGVETGFVGTGIEQAPHVVNGANAAADGQRNKHLAGDSFDDVKNQIAAVAGGGDV